MKLKVLVTPGDGIGPEITAEAIGVLQEVALRRRSHAGTELQAHWRCGHREGWNASARRHRCRSSRLRSRLFRRGGRRQIQCSSCKPAPRGRSARTARDTGRLCQPAPRLCLQGADGQQPAAAGDHRRHRHHVCPRTARRPLLWQAPRVGQGKRRSLQYHDLHAR